MLVYLRLLTFSRFRLCDLWSFGVFFNFHILFNYLGSNLLTLSITDEDYSRNTSSTVNTRNPTVKLTRYSTVKLTRYSTVKLTRYSTVKLTRYSTVKLTRYSTVKLTRYSTVKLTRYSTVKLTRYSWSRGCRGRGRDRMVVGFITSYLCNQYLSPLRLFESYSWRGVVDTTLSDKVCRWVAASQWFSLGTQVFFTNKTYLLDITEILLKVALSTITLIHITEVLLKIPLSTHNIKLSIVKFCDLISNSARWEEHVNIIDKFELDSSHELELESDWIRIRRPI